ncbi:hypothetical protein HMPREF3220_00740 [Citrobacter koseri]|nr:hypothetical protein HMPREF3220_00740 [Citrobacter koseri]
MVVIDVILITKPLCKKTTNPESPVEIAFKCELFHIFDLRVC